MNSAKQFYSGGDDDVLDQVVTFEFTKFQRKEGLFSHRLAETWQNFDYNPVAWWRLYGGIAPNLQRMALRILSLTASSSACERNWSTFESIHTKRRNRLTTSRLNQLIYIQFNSKLMSKKQKIKEKKCVDVLLSTDATEAQGLLFEGGDDHTLHMFRDEEEEGVEGIPWDVLNEAMGVDEQLQLRRSARVRGLYEDEDFESDDEDEEGREDIVFEDDENDVVADHTYLDDDDM